MAASTEDTTTASANDNNVAAPHETTKPAPQGDESSAANANGTHNSNANQGADSNKISETVEEEKAKVSNGLKETNGKSEEPSTNGSIPSKPTISEDWMIDDVGTIESSDEEETTEVKVENNVADQSSTNGNIVADDTTTIDTPKTATESATSYKSVTGILAKVKNNADMKDSDKVDTLCLLLEQIINENTTLKTDLVAMNDHISKASQGADALKKLNSAYKEQIKLVQEETDLRMKEEAVKRGEIAKSYQSTMDELSTLLETHTGHNSRLRDENVGMADKLQQLCSDGEEREKLIVSRLKEYELQIELLGHQVMKAQLEKSEIKADLTKERIEIAQELGLERERGNNLTETVRILKEQAYIYQAQLEDLGTGTGNNTKTFQHFKSQIDKMSKQLVELDKDTHQWREKYEVSSQQVKKMNSQSMEREKEIGQLKKKLDQMVKLNRTLAEERVKLSDQIKQLQSKSN